METSTWQRLKPLIDGYNLRPLRVQETAPGYFRIETTGRIYTGRITTQQSAFIRQRVGDYVASRGFRRIERFLKNMFSERMVSVTDGESMFYLTDDFVGRTLDVVDKDLKRAVENLVELHTSLDGCTKSMGATGTSQGLRYGSWAQAFKKGHGRFEVERLLLQAKVPHALPKPYWPWLGQWGTLARHALTGLDRAGYRSIAEHAAERFEVAWNSYRLNDLVLQSNDTVATRQRLDPVFDNHLYDLATLVLQICETGEVDGAIEAVELYSKLRPLSVQEKHVIYSFSVYPHDGQRLLRRLRAAGTADTTEGIADDDDLMQAERRLDSANRLLSKGLGIGR